MQEQLAHPSPETDTGAKVRAEMSPGVGTRETPGLGSEKSMPVGTGINTGLPQESVPASPSPPASCPGTLTKTPWWFRATVTPRCLPFGTGTCSETVKSR